MCTKFGQVSDKFGQVLTSLDQFGLNYPIEVWIWTMYFLFDKICVFLSKTVQGSLKVEFVYFFIFSNADKIEQCLC